MHFKKYFFSYAVLILLIFLLAASYTRFMVQNDYLVAYEGDCDPLTESCYLYCEDEDCSEPFYYTIIERHADEILTLCGTDVTLCDDAYYCDDSVEYCEIYYCNPVLDGEDACDSLSEDDYQENVFEF